MKRTSQATIEKNEAIARMHIAWNAAESGTDCHEAIRKLARFLTTH